MSAIHSPQLWPSQVTEVTLPSAPGPQCPCTRSRLILVFTIVQLPPVAGWDSQPEAIPYSPNPCLAGGTPGFLAVEVMLLLPYRIMP